MGARTASIIRLAADKYLRMSLEDGINLTEFSCIAIKRAADVMTRIMPEYLGGTRWGEIAGAYEDLVRQDDWQTQLNFMAQFNAIEPHRHLSENRQLSRFDCLHLAACALEDYPDLP